jgi:hypothetical protein
MMRTLALLALAGTGCLSETAAQAPARQDTARVITQNRIRNPGLGESSGLAASRRTPGLLWTLNDSGNPPELFAIDSAGHDRAVLRVEGARNRDWEALALARCGPTDCLYIAEVGDNRAREDTVRIYRVREPEEPFPSSRRVALSGTIQFRYEDGPRDAEAILVTGDQDVYVISKERSGGGRVYLLDRTAWGRRDMATARFIQELPLPEGSRFQVTDAALAFDGVHVAIRTYGYIYFFRLEKGALRLDEERRSCFAAGLDIQGEGITWLRDGRLVTTSERRAGFGGTVSIVECR